MHIVDLSAPIKPTTGDLPPLLRVEIEYTDHSHGAEAVESMFGVPPRLLRDGEGWAAETITWLNTHSSTHVDAPYHYNSRIGGVAAQTIDELPLEWFFAPGVVCDFSGRADGEIIDADDVGTAIEAAGHELAAGDIVLIRSGRDALYEQPDYLRHGPGVSADATRWLYERGVRVMGIDAWGWDRPLYMEAEEALAEDAPGIFWAAHQVNLPYCQIERLFNLDRLPGSGFQVACFPLRIVGASAAPARVVAIIEATD
ncbi:MAG TPA: cyclase family protein [Solirubrobacteraceae bacterium]|jgi:kynurenine formamidase|nr:cyclase family protein [Solirubrobacteraceae bacterium]